MANFLWMSREGNTLEQWLTEWITCYAPGRCRSRKTIERYRELAGYVTGGPSEQLRELAGRPLKGIRHIELEPALLALVGAKGKRRALSARSVRHIAGLLSVAFKKAFKLEIISENPMLKVDLPVMVMKEARSLTLAEIQILRLVYRHDWTFPLIELALATGCRRGELLAFEWSDLDWGKRAIVIRRSLEQTADGLRVKNTKSEKPRVCSLPQAAMVALESHRPTTNGKLIFCDRNGDHLNPALVSQTIVRRLQRVGIRNASLHTLRHTHASNLLSRGVPLPAVSARLGHADTNITARIYSHALPADDRRAADAWDSLLLGAA
jgi:integrase